jgi:hypothetical protein
VRGKRGDEKKRKKKKDDSASVESHHRVAPTKRPYDGWMIVFVIVMKSKNKEEKDEGTLNQTSRKLMSAGRSRLPSKSTACKTGSRGEQSVMQDQRSIHESSAERWYVAVMDIRQAVRQGHHRIQSNNAREREKEKEIKRERERLQSSAERWYVAVMDIRQAVRQGHHRMQRDRMAKDDHSKEHRRQ